MRESKASIYDGVRGSRLGPLVHGLAMLLLDLLLADAQHLAQLRLGWCPRSRLKMIPFSSSSWTATTSARASSSKLTGPESAVIVGWGRTDVYSRGAPS